MGNCTMFGTQCLGSKSDSKHESVNENNVPNIKMIMEALHYHVLVLSMHQNMLMKCAVLNFEIDFRKSRKLSHEFNGRGRDRLRRRGSHLSLRFHCFFIIRLKYR